MLSVFDIPGGFVRASSLVYQHFVCLKYQIPPAFGWIKYRKCSRIRISFLYGTGIATARHDFGRSKLSMIFKTVFYPTKYYLKFYSNRNFNCFVRRVLVGVYHQLPIPSITLHDVNLKGCVAGPRPQPALLVRQRPCSFHSDLLLH